MLFRQLRSPGVLLFFELSLIFKHMFVVVKDALTLIDRGLLVMISLGVRLVASSFLVNLRSILVFELLYKVAIDHAAVITIVAIVEMLWSMEVLVEVGIIDLPDVLRRLIG